MKIKFPFQLIKSKIGSKFGSINERQMTQQSKIDRAKSWILFFQNIGVFDDHSISKDKLESDMADSAEYPLHFYGTDDFGEAIRATNEILSKTPREIKHFRPLFGEYNPSPYSKNKTMEVVLGSIKKLSAKYGDEIPLVYTTLPLPVPENYPSATWREIFGIKSFEKEDCGHLDLIDVLLELQKEKIVELTSFEVLHADNFKLTFKVTINWKEFQESDPDEIKISNQIFEVYYNDKTGVGYVNGEKFKFKNNQPEFVVFREMYEDVNNPIPRKKVLELAGCKEEAAPDYGILKRNNAIPTYFINRLAKKMRKRTGLNTDGIVNNNGELTLVATKLETVPNLPQK